MSYTALSLVFAVWMSLNRKTWFGVDALGTYMYVLVGGIYYGVHVPMCFLSIFLFMSNSCFLTLFYLVDLCLVLQYIRLLSSRVCRCSHPGDPYAWWYYLFHTSMTAHPAYVMRRCRGDMRIVRSHPQGTSAPGCECTEHVPAVDLSASSQHVVVSDRQEVRFVDPVCPIRWLVVAGSSPLLLLRA